MPYIPAHTVCQCIHPGPGPSPGESLKAFVVAERRGKGESAMVTFKHFGTQGPRVSEQVHCDAGLERKMDYQNTPWYFPFFHQSGLWAPVSGDSLQYGNTEVYHSAFLNQQSQMSTPRVQSEPSKDGDAKISTIVYSSKSVRDPRLSGRDVGDPNRTGSVAPQMLRLPVEDNVMNAQKDLPKSQLKANEGRSNTAGTGTFPKNSEQACTIESAEADFLATQKSEKLPSLKLFKMKFQKYSIYFQMNKAERIHHIWSRTDLPLDQKSLLLDRIHYYEYYYDKYKKGQLFSEDTKGDQSLLRGGTNETNVYQTETHISNEHTDDKAAKQTCTQLRTPGQSELNSTQIQGQFNNKQSKEDITTPDVALEQMKHTRPEPTPLTDQEHDALPNGHIISKEQTVNGSDSRQPNSFLLASRVSSKHCKELENTEQVQTQMEEARTIPPASHESYVEGPLVSQSLTAEDSMKGLGEEGLKEASIGAAERREEEPSENIAFANEGEFLDVGICEEVCTINEMEIPTAPIMSSQGRDINLMITAFKENWNEKEAFMNFKNNENLENCHMLKTNDSEISGNTIYRLLYERLQRNGLLQNSTPIYGKPYLKLKSLKQTTTSIKSSFVNHVDIQEISNYDDCGVLHKNKNKKENPTLGITTKSNIRDLNDAKKPLTLSERFSLLLCSKREQLLSSLLRDSIQVDESKCLTESISSKAEEHISNFNVKLVRLLTQKYNECQSKTRKYKKLREMSDLKSTIYHKRSQRSTSNITLEKAFRIKRHYFKTLPRARRETKLYRVSFQKQNNAALSKEPSQTAETRNEAELEQRVEIHEQCHKSQASTSNDNAVEISYTYTECLPSKVSEQPADQIQNTEGQKSSGNHNSNTNKTGHDLSAVSKDLHKEVEIESATNQEKDEELLQKDQDVTDESGSVVEIKCFHNEKQAENAISTKDCLSNNINPDSEVQNDSALENTCDNNATHLHVETAQPPLNTKDQASLVSSGEDKSHMPFVEQKLKCGTDNQEIKLISRLRNYLTKFETTVKLQEPLDEITPALSQQALNSLSKDGTMQRSLSLEAQKTEAVKLESRNSDPEQKPLFPKPGSLADSIPNHSVTSTSQQNSLPMSVNDPPTTTQCEPVSPSLPAESTPSLITCGPKPVSRLSPDSTTMLGTVWEKASPYPLIELSRPKLLPEPQQMQSKKPGVDFFTQSIQKGNGQSSGAINLAMEKPKTHRQISEDNEVIFVEAAQGPQPYAKTLNTIPFQRNFNTEDISNLLKEADCGGLDDLRSLVPRAKSMLQYFISNFERDQGVAVRSGLVTRDIILDKYLHQAPAPFDLKCEALTSFLELQMMVEAKEFIENKMSYLTAKQTFRTLLWYDPSLYGELFKGRVGYQQQSCVYTSFQQGLATEGYSKLQNYYMAVTTLNQQLKAVPQTSYYLYLKSKREKLEIEAALRHFADCESFFLSVPISSMINFGDSPEQLEKLQNRVISFVETPAEKMPGTFDVGKAEHLSIICRFLQEKINRVKTSKVINNQISWFGLEHLLYDASKTLVARDMVQTLNQQTTLKPQSINPNRIYGAQDAWLPVLNRPPQMSLSRGGMIPGQQIDMNGSHIQSVEEKRLHLRVRLVMLTEYVLDLSLYAMDGWID